MCFKIVHFEVSCFKGKVVHTVMDLMPTEILSSILLSLKGSDRLRASFTCRRWLALMSSSLPRSIQLCVYLDPTSCHAHLSHSLDMETTITICICEEHVRTHAVLLSYLFSCIANDIRSLVIDDDLIVRVNSYLYQLYLILSWISLFRSLRLEFL